MDVEYDLQALKDGLLKIDKNIAIFEKAIADEEETKRQYRHMIRVLEEEKALREAQHEDLAQPVGGDNQLARQRRRNSGRPLRH